jgi:hypothetical protein
MRGLIAVAALSVALLGIAQAADPPAARPADKPAARPVAQPTAQPTVQPGAKPAAKPAGQSPVKPADKPATASTLGPTEADLLAAYRIKLDWVNQATRQFLPDQAERLRLRVDNLELVECDRLEDFPNHFLCSVLVSSAIGERETESKRVELVMTKEGNVWKAQ